MNMKYTKLKYDEFEEYLLEATNSKFSGNERLRYIFKFENGYGASVIKNGASYGGMEDLFELAVIKFSDHYGCHYGWKLCYDTEITDDVIGWLDNNDVLELLERIKNL